MSKEFTCCITGKPLANTDQKVRIVGSHNTTWFAKPEAFIDLVSTLPEAECLLELFVFPERPRKKATTSLWLMDWFTNNPKNSQISAFADGICDKTLIHELFSADARDWLDKANIQNAASC